jgi:hypothetical protein
MSRINLQPVPFIPAHFVKAARAYACCNRSDPFAYGRMIAHLVRGIEDATAVQAWAGRPTRAVTEEMEG